jgi:hypothetical protein
MQAVRSVTVAVVFSAILAIASVATYFASAPRSEILLGSPVDMAMVPLKAAGANMPVVYVMEPVQPGAQNTALAYPSSATQLAQVKPASLSDLPVSVAFPLPHGVMKANARAPVRHANIHSHKQLVERATKPNMPVPTARERQFESAYPVETEAQAVRRAKILARQEYLATYQTAIKVACSPKMNRTPIVPADFVPDFK